MDSDFRTRRGLRGFSVNRLIPNVLTIAALCSGLTAMSRSRLIAELSDVPEDLEGVRGNNHVSVVPADGLDAPCCPHGQRSSSLLLGLGNCFGGACPFQLDLVLEGSQSGTQVEPVLPAEKSPI